MQPIVCLSPDVKTTFQDMSSLGSLSIGRRCQPSLRSCGAWPFCPSGTAMSQALTQLGLQAESEFWNRHQVRRAEMLLICSVVHGGKG